MDKNSSMISKTKKVNKKLIPAIIQDFETKEVLMLAYMNKKSLEKSIQTGATWFWSRKRDRLWNKGETSGNFQKIKQIKYDCDSDTLLIVVEQIGNACHTGNKSCFYRELNEKKGDLEKLNFTKLGSNNKNILNELYRVISKRIKEKAENSYTYSLHEKGLDEVIKKFGEESIEIILSAKHQEKKKVIYEIADLMYHLIVLMVERKITLVEVFEELESRRK